MARAMLTSPHVGEHNGINTPSTSSELPTAVSTASSIHFDALQRAQTSGVLDAGGGDSPRTPRLFLRPRARSMGAGLAPLLQMMAGINGRMGFTTSTTLTITRATLAYGRYEVPLDEIEQATSVPSG